MAHDTHTIHVSIEMQSPEYEFTNADQYSEHVHHNIEQKQAIYDAVLEQISSAMPVVIVNGETFDLKALGKTSSANDITTEVELTDDEKALFEKAAEEEQDGWDRFHAEIDRREAAEDTDLFEVGPGVYSMGDLYGPISQLDETAHKGVAQVVIIAGWGDEEPVYSTSAILNPTNWDMFKMFCQALAKSNDDHHVFLEGLEYFRTDADGVAIYRAITGS